MNARSKQFLALGALAALSLFALSAGGQGTGKGQGLAPAKVTMIVPADAKVFFDGDATTQTGTERTYLSPALPRGKQFHYNVLVRWTENGKAVEQTRRVTVRAGSRVRIALPEKAPGDDSKGKDKQVVTTKAAKRTPATAINFKKAYNLPFASLGTLGARIEAARRTPDPVALAHTASELAVAEKVSGKKASLTSKALVAEAAELARLRRQVAEMRATFAVQQQIANEETDVNYWNYQISLAEGIARRERDAILSNELPGDAPRKLLLNNYTTQYIDLWVNGFYKMQIPPGGSKWCAIEHKTNPTTVTAYGNEDDAVWGPRQLFGAYKTYTWNLQ